MPPKTIHVVRHAQGEHNAARNYTLSDPLLTPLGKQQCQALSTTFPSHSSINVIFSSPLRRTIQTAALSFGPILARPEVPFILLPELQELSDLPCDTGVAGTQVEVKSMVGGLFEEGEVGFDLGRVDAREVREGWNVKTGYWANEKQAILHRAQDLRNWLYQRPEEQILLVTHGGFAHFLTEDWNDVDDPMQGTAYSNCEHREFHFTPESTALNAHVVETEGSRKKRNYQPKGKEADEQVVEEVKSVVGDEM